MLRPANFIFALVFRAWHANADIPVHCLKHEIVGEWELFLSPPSKERTHCGHKTPDREEAQPPVVLTIPPGGSSTKVVFHQSNRAKDMSTGEEGGWTMVYDEGFAFELGKISYFAFSRFDFVASLTGSKTAKSTCSETIQGWYSDQDRTMYGCYTARRVEAAQNNTVLVAAKVNNHHHKAPAKHSASVGTNHTTPLPDSYHHQAVLALNQRKGATWTAKVYSRWLGKSMHELALLQGIQRRWSRKDVKNGERKPLTYLQKVRTNATSVPQALDWRSNNGKNFLEPVMDQGSCGSCYAVAGVRMLTARHRIAQKDPSLEPFSISYPMACSEYNQGCKGGYGILIAKWSMDVGLVPESCAPYDVVSTCNQDYAAKCPRVKMWRAANPRYVGGFYGATNEENMKQELFTNGPVTTGFAVADDFMWYSQGIYSSGQDIPKTGDWVKVDHGVLMIGWGEENSVKYWTCQNSWGPGWGEDGYFRIKRGENLGGIESICEAADVIEDEKKGAMVASFTANP
eukprot:gnl/MRDRNA2_/MRDRNA2_77480_c0_seq1.p1 gnl/MRDRNA2_/MRDRNA2_77480_c0~~gnl/MRDRNA2_/MRDRNA2_77480_c0_seq1.p1  ORF type:complete len:514 (-),score=81.24 gnl/MRDRNA2_/MRDRNA2_77480_c0_seq1:216-1757(-)